MSKNETGKIPQAVKMDIPPAKVPDQQGATPNSPEMVAAGPIRRRGFLEYSNMTHSNIIPKEEFEDLVQEVFNVIATNLGKSLGPLGSSATILDGMMTSATKDGYSILKHYRFHNRYKKMIYNLIMAPCTRANNSVGDGTTSVICATSALFNRYKQMKILLETFYRLPRDFTKVWDEVINDLCDYVAKSATPIDPEDYDTIFHLAYVVSNGNEEVSKNIAEVYRQAKSPAIKQKDSPTNKSYISAIDGFEFPANLISDVFVRNEDLSVQENDFSVIIMDHKLETDTFTKIIQPINEVLRAQGKKLLVLAPYFDNHMCETVISQYLGAEKMRYGCINLMMAQFELGKLDPHQMTDLAIILRAKVLTQDMITPLAESINGLGSDVAVDRIFEDPTYEYYRMVGKCAHALMTCKTGCIFKVDGIEEDENYQKALTAARKDLEDIKAEVGYERQAFAAKVYEANARVLQLEMKNFIYYIGADSQLQHQITWDSVEDVIKCIRSATKYGVVPGCQLTIMDGCLKMIGGMVEYPITDSSVLDKLNNHDRLKVEIINLIYSAFCDVYCMVLHGGDGMGMVKLLPRWNTTTMEGAKDLRDEAIAKADGIVNESIKRMEVFDIESLEYSKDIITSAETDKVVLLAASELVKVLISGNQCIFLDSDVNESHQETVDAYV